MTKMEKGGKPVLFWCILVWLTGILYLWLGAMLRFRGQYDLINNFWADQKSGKLDEKFARRYGVISMASGIFSIALGVAALLIGGLRGAAVLGAAILVPLIAFRVSYVRSVRR